MPSLFMVMLGGRHARANTEVHDVVMAIGESLSELTPQLKHAWFGELKGLHIDAWAQISGVQSQDVNYQIHFSDAAPSASDKKLYLINLGAIRQIFLVNCIAIILSLQLMQWRQNSWANSSLNNTGISRIPIVS